MSSTLPVRLIDRRAQRFGAGLSALVLGIALVGANLPLVAVVAAALAVGSLVGTRWFLFGRPWPVIVRVLRLGPATDVEPELGPRFAQALGSIVLSVGLGLGVAGAGVIAWLPVLGVLALQTLLAVTGYCLGCRLYGLHWLLPDLFDRFVLRRDPAARPS